MPTVPCIVTALKDVYMLDLMEPDMEPIEFLAHLFCYYGLQRQDEVGIILFSKC